MPVDAQNYQTARKYLDLRKLTGQERLTSGPQLAQQLALILERDPQFDPAAVDRHPEGDDKDGLAADRERIDTFMENGKSLPVDMERVTLRTGLAVWLFTPETVASIPRIAQLASDSPIERVLPAALVTWTMLDTPVWRWIALALLAIVAAALSRLLSRLFLLRHRSPPETPSAAGTSECVRRFPGSSACPAGNRCLSRGNGLGWSRWRGRVMVERTLTLIFFLGLAWLGAAIVEVDGGAAARRAPGTASNVFLLGSAARIARTGISEILILAITTILSDWGYNTSTILAGLGVGGLAIALAAQKTVENLFGGVSVISDRPVGGWRRLPLRRQTGHHRGYWVRSTKDPRRENGR